MKRVAILGSSGSIGTTTLKVIAQFGQEFKLQALTVNRNIDILIQQITAFKPLKVAVANEQYRGKLAASVGKRVDIYAGREGLEKIASDKDVDIVVIALSGACALFPLLAAIRAGKQIALANKEALVMAGAIITDALKESKSQIIPVDSEQSAIFQHLSETTISLNLKLSNISI